jgi:membrane-associated phospholipid phosphatase
LKFLIGRARPELLADYGAYSLTPFTGNTLFESFPSGHSTAAGAFFGAFAMVMPQLRPLFLLSALLIGVSRVVVGAHYPSDVAAGLLLGLWVALMMAFLFARRGWLFTFGPGRLPVLKNAEHRRSGK